MKKTVIAILAAVSAIPAMAGDIYGGASVGRTEQKLSAEGISGKETATGFKVFGGYQFTPVIGAEVGYVQFGDVSASESGASASIEPKSFYAAVTGTLPVTAQISAFGKVGVARNRTEVNLSYLGASYSEKLNKTSALVGVGIGYAINAKVSVIAEYEYFGKVLKADGASVKADLLSVGVRYKF